MANSTKIDSIRDFTGQGLRELELFLEPWLKGKMKGVTGGTAGVPSISYPNVMAFSISGTLTVQNGVQRWYPMQDGLLSVVHCALGGTPTGAGGVTVRVRKNSTTSVGSVMVASGQFTASFFASPDEFIVGDYYTVDVTTVGGTNPGSALVVQLYGTFNG